jgi:hypothetical protein
MIRYDEKNFTDFIHQVKKVLNRMGLMNWNNTKSDTQQGITSFIKAMKKSSKSLACKGHRHIAQDSRAFEKQGDTGNGHKKAYKPEPQLPKKIYEIENATEDNSVK